MCRHACVRCEASRDFQARNSTELLFARVVSYLLVVKHKKGNTRKGTSAKQRTSKTGTWFQPLQGGVINKRVKAFCQQIGLYVLVL